MPYRSPPHIERGSNLFKRGITGALADAVDGALHLPCARVDGGQRVRNGQTKVVVAVRGEHDSLRIDRRNALAHFAEHLCRTLREWCSQPCPAC